MGYDIFHFGMQFFMYQLLAGCFPHHCLCHGMREMLLQAGGDPKKFICGLSVKGYHIRHGGLCLGQSSGLIKYDGSGIGHSLQVFAALHRDLVGACLADRGQYR